MLSYKEISIVLNDSRIGFNQNHGNKQINTFIVITARNKPQIWLFRELAIIDKIRTIYGSPGVLVDISEMMPRLLQNTPSPFFFCYFFVTDS